MNARILLIVCAITYCQSFSYSQEFMTRGWQSGEIFFLGRHQQVSINDVLYYSTDFGQTATCVNTEMNFAQIVTDKTQGYIYFTNIWNATIFLSTNYGYDWTMQSTYSYYRRLLSGVKDGWVYRKIYQHSEDYGSTFIDHSCAWIPNNQTWVKYAELDNDSIHGYIYCWDGELEKAFFGLTTNHFDSLIFLESYGYHPSSAFGFARGYTDGELFIAHNIDSRGKIRYTNNYGVNFMDIEEINLTVMDLWYMTTGNQEGEVYCWASKVTSMYENYNVYIFHSMDYGRTFEIFNPVGWGIQPVLANFSAEQKTGIAPFSIDWYNFSIGEDLSYEWDFENDGIVDSNEENPTYTYEEPGIYSVSLNVSGPDGSNSFTKENYITVYPFPAQPQDLTAEVMDDDVYLNWQAIEIDTAFLGYNIYRDTTILTLEPITATNYEDLNQSNGTYKYCVEAVYTYAVSEQTCVEASITVGIDELCVDNITIYPNPVVDEILINFPGTFQVTVYNSIGMLVFPEKPFRYHTSISVRIFPKGIYYVLVKTGGRKIISKIVICTP
ncbi:MAG TPA: PKD domain-containing protein [Bacteroidales bacterium]|nr:PKD domain-containing protein [Bacteroidales bacterium]